MYKIALLGLMFLPLSGCGGCRNSLKHTQSNWFGLNRKITLYDANGGVIKEWTVKSKVEDNGGYFLTDEGKAVRISGTFIIEEQ